MRRLLLATALAIAFSAVATPSRSAPATALTVSSRAYGLRITLSVPNITYTREHFVDARVIVRNFSRKTVHLYGYPATCWWNGYGGSNPLVIERGGSGSIVFPPPLPRTVSCPRPHLYSLYPGRTVNPMLYIPARGRWLEASVRIAVPHGHALRAVTVSSPRLKISIQ